MKSKDILDLDKDYVVFSADGQHQRWTAEDFWKAAFSPSHPAFHKDMGALVSRYSFDSDWTSWEKHPNGDELAFVTKGRIVFILEGKPEVELKAGDAFLIPKGSWHRAKVPKPAEVLFITFGYGTEHRDLS